MGLSQLLFFAIDGSQVVVNFRESRVETMNLLKQSQSLIPTVLVLFDAAQIKQGYLILGIAL